MIDWIFFVFIIGFFIPILLNLTKKEIKNYETGAYYFKYKGESHYEVPYYYAIKRRADFLTARGWSDKEM